MINPELYELWHEFHKLPPRTMRADRRDVELESILYRLYLVYQTYEADGRGAEPGDEAGEEEKPDETLADTMMELCHALYDLLRLPYGERMQPMLKDVQNLVGEYERNGKFDLLGDQIDEALSFLVKNNVIAQLEPSSTDPSDSPSERDISTSLEELARLETNIREATEEQTPFPWEDAIWALVIRWQHRLARAKKPYTNRMGAPIQKAHILTMTTWEAFKILEYDETKTEVVAYVYPAELLTEVLYQASDQQNQYQQADTAEDQPHALGGQENQEKHYPTLYRLEATFKEGVASEVSVVTPIPVKTYHRLFIEVNVCPRLHAFTQDRQGKPRSSDLLWEPLNDPDKRAVAVTINRLTHAQWKNKFGSLAANHKLIIQNYGSHQAALQPAERNTGVLSLRAFLMTPLGPVQSKEVQIVLQLVP